MSILLKYRKPGGFLQLIQSVETTEPQRRHGLLQSIAQEDPGWASLIQSKMLTPERILAWPEKVLAKIWPHIPLNIIMILWQKSASASRARIENSLPQNYYLPFRRAAEAIKPLEGSGVITANLKLVAIVRELQISGRLNFADIDRALLWDHEIVDTLDPFKMAA